MVVKNAKHSLAYSLATTAYVNGQVHGFKRGYPLLFKCTLVVLFVISNDTKDLKKFCKRVQMVHNALYQV